MKKFCVGLSLALWPLWVLAWGQEGHSTVAEMAQRQLNASTRAALEAVLPPGTSLASISNWADTVAHGARADTYGWHFVDIPLAQRRYERTRDCVYQPKSGLAVPDDCVVLAIESNAAVLGNTAAALTERQDALKFLVHFVGDIHQPLHTVREATGGNDIMVTFLSTPNSSNTTQMRFHALWDSGLFRARYFSWGEQVDQLDGTWFRSGKSAAWADPCIGAREPVVCWAEESHAIANLPGRWVAPNAVLGKEYQDLVNDDYESQLVHASIRLARMLGDVLGR